MKRIITALGVCALLFTWGTAYAIDFSWDDDANTQRWDEVLNWDLDAGYPDDSGDRATISVTGNGWPVLYSNITIGELIFNNGTSANPKEITTDDGVSSYKLTVSAGAHSGKVIVTDSNSECAARQHGDGEIEAIGMDIIAGDNAGEHAAYELYDGTLDVNGLVTVKASQLASATATIQIDSDTTFQPNMLCFHGWSHIANGHAIGVFNENVTVLNNSNDNVSDTWAIGGVDWTIGEDNGGVTLDAKDLELNPHFYTQLTVIGTATSGARSALNTSTFRSNGWRMSLTNVEWVDY